MSDGQGAIFAFFLSVFAALQCNRHKSIISEKIGQRNDGQRNKKRSWPSDSPANDSPASSGAAQEEAEVRKMGSEKSPVFLFLTPFF